MRNVEFTLFDFDDLLIEPAHISPIRSRKEINPKYDNGYYPLMTAPMDTVISKDNHKLFGNLGIRSVVPRGEGYYDQNYNDTHFNSYGLDEFNEIFINGDVEILTDSKIYVLIDIANGHMRALYDSAKTAKEKYGDKMVLMIGNVANPKTFAEYCSIGVDYIRIGIGNGGGCLTTVQTGVGFPMASLIEECYDVKKYMEFPNIKIVADGGFKSYSDIIKALALEVQKSWGKEELKTSEGVVRTHKVEYTLEGWINNFDSYLRSAMSYTGKKELHEFIGGVQLNFISQNSYKRFSK